jgi:hypothetical protein
MPTRCRRSPLLAPLAALALAAMALVAAAPAEARAVPMRVDAAATCAPKSVFVRFADGEVRRVQHFDPGPPIKRITARSRNLFLVLRLRASWGEVKRGAGTTFQITAEGPRGERWRWQFRVASPNPEDDSSNYIVCFRPKASGGSVVPHLRRNPGRWTFRAVVVKGRLVGSRDGVVLAVR